MGFRCGTVSSVQIGRPASGTRRTDKNNSRFLTSYSDSFAPASSLGGQVGFLKLGNLSSQAVRAPRRVKSEGLLSCATQSAQVAWGSSRPQSRDQGSRQGTSQTRPLRMADQVSCRNIGEAPESIPAEFWSTNRSSKNILDHTPRMIRRAVTELLTSPDLKVIAKKFYDSRSHVGRREGQLPAGEVGQVIRSLIKEFSLPEHCAGIADLLLKRFDVNNDDVFSFQEFFDLVSAMLRRAAFDKSEITGRNFFVSQATEPVWETWQRLKKLGEGSFGEAFTCKHKRSQEVRVIKAIKKSQALAPVEDIEREILVMREIDHPNIVRLFLWHEDATRIYLVMEALQGGTLRDVLFHKGQKHRAIPEDWIRKVMSQCIEGMAFCHKLRVVHKDLKDENIMLLRQDPDYDKPFAVIIDLGLAEMFSLSEPRCQQCGGTPTTMAPEVWLNDFGPKCDVWSLGIVLYEMLTGCFPFIAKSLQPMAWVRLQKRGADWSKVAPRSSALGTTLCRSMLTFAEKERPSMSACLQHEWFRTNSGIKGQILPQQFAKLKSFCGQTKLQRTLLLEIASRLPIEQAGQVLEMFQSFDADKDGSVSKAELRFSFSQMGMGDEDLIARIFSTLDVDSDGLLSLSEFSAGILVLFKDLLDDRLHALFKRRDRDGNGYLDLEEAQIFLADSSAMLTRDANQRSFDLLAELMQGGETKIKYEDLKGKLLAF